MRYDYSVKLDRISGKATITDQPFQTKYVEVPRDERFRKLYSYILVKMDLEKSCEGEILKDKEGQPIFDKYGQPVIVGAKPPTITGLALALGFATRKSLLEYEGKKEFVNTIARAKSRVEQYAEERLFDRDGANGAKFSLANNFKGWSEKTDVKVSGSLEAEKTKLDSILKQVRGDGS